MTSGTYIKISAGDYETDLQHGLQVCQKVEVMRLEKKRRLLYDKPLNRINH